MLCFKLNHEFDRLQFHHQSYRSDKNLVRFPNSSSKADGFEATYSDFSLTIEVRSWWLSYFNQPVTTFMSHIEIQATKWKTSRMVLDKMQQNPE